MFLTEYNQEKVLEQERREALQVGRQEGINEEKERVATDMLKRNLPLSLIHDISKLSEETILKLAKTLGVTVMWIFESVKFHYFVYSENNYYVYNWDKSGLSI